MYIWTELEQVLATEATDVLHVGQIIELYLDLMAEHLQNTKFKIRHALEGAHMFLESPAIRAHYSYCRRWLVALLKTKIDEPGEYVTSLGAILLCDMRENLESVAKTIAENGAVPQIVATFWLFRYTDMGATQVYLSLIYRLLLAKEMPYSDVESLSYDMVEYLFRRVCSDDAHDDNDSASRDNDDDEEEDESLHLLLALNEYYAASPNSENKVLNVLKADLYRYRSMGGRVVVLANRTSSPMIKILVCKFLYFIFTTPETYNFIYTNDLKVLVEVLLRELSDLPLEADGVRQMYLRVLHVLLENTTIGDEKFKQSDIVSVLRCTIEYATSDTRRLAERCLAVEWLQWSRHGSFVSVSSEEAARDEGDSDTDSENDEDEDEEEDESQPNNLIPQHSTPSYAVTLRGKPLPPPPRNIRSSSSVHLALARPPPPPPPPPPRRPEPHSV